MRDESIVIVPRSEVLGEWGVVFSGAIGPVLSPMETDLVGPGVQGRPAIVLLQNLGNL